MKRQDKSCLGVQDILLNPYVFIPLTPCNTVWRSCGNLPTCVRDCSLVKAVPNMHTFGKASTEASSVC